MGDLFRDELDEPSPTRPFRREHGEQGGLFMDEADEDANQIRQSRSGGSKNLNRPFHEEPEEHEPQLFGDEPAESECETDSSDEAFADINEGSKSLVELSFSTISKFLSTQLAKGSPSASTSSQPARKKRYYDNSKRAAKAQQRKTEIEPPAPRQKRNCPAA